MGSKGSAAPPPVATQSSGMDPAIMEMMMGMMARTSALNDQAMMQQPQQLPPPEVVKAAPVDWKSQMEDLGKKAKYDAEGEDRKGRLSTIHSSLTDDDEDTEMNQSLLGTE